MGDACEAAPPGGGPGPGGGLPRDVTAPKLDLLTLSTRRFRAANLGGSIAVRVGTRVGYALSEAASVRFSVERAASGRRVGRRCVGPTRTNRARPRCTRWPALRGSFTHRGSSGVNRFLFTGRLAGRALSSGSYRLVAQAVDAAGNRSRALRLTFTVVS